MPPEQVEKPIITTLQHAHLAFSAHLHQLRSTDSITCPIKNSQTLLMAIEMNVDVSEAFEIMPPEQLEQPIETTLRDANHVYSAHLHQRPSPDSITCLINNSQSSLIPTEMESKVPDTYIIIPPEQVEKPINTILQHAHLAFSAHLHQLQCTDLITCPIKNIQTLLMATEMDVIVSESFEMFHATRSAGAAHQNNSAGREPCVLSTLTPTAKSGFDHMPHQPKVDCPDGQKIGPECT